MGKEELRLALGEILSSLCNKKLALFSIMYFNRTRRKFYSVLPSGFITGLSCNGNSGVGGESYQSGSVLALSFLSSSPFH